jgi:lipopolysaccharide assembly outer membrane protein LptD (OstA)
VARARRAPALLPVVWFALSVCAAPARAQLPELESDEPVEITADRIDYFQERDLYVAEGNVHVVQQGKSLRARWATFSGRTRLGVASGNVRYRDGDEVVEASFIQFDVDSLQGVVFGGEIDLGEQAMRIAAEELVRTGEDHYRVFNARFTTCRCPDPDATPPWELNAGRSEVEIGGYGTSRNTTLEVLGVPVVWLPWIVYPVKTERQTGLLVPRLSAGGRNGFAVAQPLFWAARRDVNVTYTPGYSEDRGWKQDLEIEAVHGQRSFTRIKGGFAWDEDAPTVGNRIVRTETVGMARGYAELHHDQDLPSDLRLKINATYITDNEYVLDFDDLRQLRRDRFLESSAFAFRHYGSDGRFGLELASLFADDLQSTEFDDRDPYLLQRWVDLEAQWQPGPIAGQPWLSFGLDANYEYFGRFEDPLSTFRDRGYATTPAVIGRRFVDTGISAIPPPPPPVPADATRADGFYQEGEPLFDKGHRANIHPRLSIPLRLFDTIEWNVEGGWRQTLYYSDERQFEERGLATGRSDLLIRMARRFDRGGGRVIEHRMIPRLSWVYVSQDRGQDRNPLFTPRAAVTQYRLRQRALDNVILDPSDEIPGTNRLVLAFDHRLYRGKSRRQLLGEFGLGIDYDFASGGRVGRFVAEGRHIRLGWTLNRFQVALDAKRGKVDEVFAVTSVRWPWRIGTRFGYRYVPDGPDFFEALQTDKFEGFSSDFDEINQIFASVSLPLFDRFRLRYQANYTFSGSFFLTNSGSLDYISRCRCWAAGIQLSESRDENLRFQFRYTLVGLGDDADNPFRGVGWLRTD